MKVGQFSAEAEFSFPTSLKCPAQCLADIPAHWQPHSSSSSNTWNLVVKVYEIFEIFQILSLLKNIKYLKYFTSPSAPKLLFFQHQVHIEKYFNRRIYVFRFVWVVVSFASIISEKVQFAFKYQFFHSLLAHNHLLWVLLCQMGPGIKHTVRVGNQHLPFLDLEYKFIFCVSFNVKVRLSWKNCDVD